MKNTKIGWCDATFNPWIGCTKVSPGCANCYADSQDKFRKWTPDGWGHGKPRKRTSAAYWKHPLKWNAEYELAVDEAMHDFGSDTYEPPPRKRVFCGSLCDWLDDEVPVEWLADMLAVIHATENLDWLLLTKRPENFRKRIHEAYKIIATHGTNGTLIADVWNWQKEGGNRENNRFPRNVWIGTSVEDQQRAEERIPHLIQIPAKVRFLSCEPLLQLVNIFETGLSFLDVRSLLNWVICGGESGPNARPMERQWALSLWQQCSDAGVSFFFKQWGGKDKDKGGDTIDGISIKQFPKP